MSIQTPLSSPSPNMPLLYREQPHATEEENRVAEIRATLETFWSENEFGEIRILGNVPQSGLFNDFDKAATYALAAELEGYQAYFTLNHIEMWSVKGMNRLNEIGTGAAMTDQAIRERRWLFIDADPVRDACTGTTSEERIEALNLVYKVRDYLTSLGWPAPIMADSGNGYHLFYRVSLPTDDGNITNNILRRIDNNFSTAKVKFDTSVGNPARICRLHGTLNTKGCNTVERPYRRSKLLEVPNTIEAVDTLLLAKFVDSESRNETDFNGNSIQSFEIDTIDDIVLAVELDQARKKLRCVPIAIEGKKGSKKCFRAACILMREFKFTVEQALPLLTEYSDRCEPPWSEKELRHKLKSAATKTDCSKSEAPADKPAPKRSRKSQADKLLAMAQSLCELWRQQYNDEPYATMKLPKRGPATPQDAWHYENHAVNSKTFSEFLIALYCEYHHKVPGRQAVADAVSATAALARRNGRAEEIFTRVARKDDVIYLDLVDERWQAVEITASGWNVVSKPNCKFRRAPGMLPLPKPKRGGKTSDFHEILNMTADNLKLVLGWLTMLLHGRGPYPILAIQGEQGSAKSTTASMIRRLIDPNIAPSRSTPRDERDLFIGATNSQILFFDNASYLTAEISDSLCRLATGGSFATRKLYTDGEEALFSVCRPILMTSIGGVITRSDLVDRAIIVEAPVIPESEFSTSGELSDKFERLSPYLLGLLLDGAVLALQNHRAVRVIRKNRMLDFQSWSAAAMPAFGWTASEFLDTYSNNIDAASGVVLEGNPVVLGIKALLELHQGEWPKNGAIKGCQNLLIELEGLYIGRDLKGMPGWPTKANTLGSTLRRLAPALRKTGIMIEFLERQTTGSRTMPIRIKSVVANAECTNVVEANIFERSSVSDS